MFNILGKILRLMTNSDKKTAIWVCIISFALTIIDVAGMGSIIPFLAVLGDLELIDNNKYLSGLYQFLGLNDRLHFILIVGLFALAFLLLAGILRFFSFYSLSWFSNKLRYSIGTRLFQSYLSQEYKCFFYRNSSEMLKMIFTETDMMIGKSVLPFIRLINGGLTVLVIAIILLYIDFYLTFIVLAFFGGIYLFLIVGLRKFLERLGRQFRASNSQLYKMATESFGGIKDIKLRRSELNICKNFKAPAMNFAETYAKFQTISLAPRCFVEVFCFGGILTVALYYLKVNPNNLGGVLPTLGFYALAGYRLLPAAQGIFIALASINYGSSLIDNILADLEMGEEAGCVEHDEVKARLGLKESLKIAGLKFAYENVNCPVINSLSLDIKANTTTAIIGKTGSGKSTLIDIILGLLKPQAGFITVDNVKITEDNMAKWQNNLGYVPQNIFLVDASIKANIAFGIDPLNVDDKKVQQAAKLAQIHRFIINLPDGYDTITGERGVRLSGGQRQRIAIARALYHDPEVLLFDEATSALDMETEKELLSAIDNLKGRKTIVMVAHRPAALERCDQIIDLS